MGGMYSMLFTLIPTALFILIIVIAIILGIVRGFRKSLILAIQALAAFITCIIIFAILANNSQVDTNIVNIANTFMGSGGLQKQLGVSTSSTSITEILYEFIPKQMDYGDGIELILRDNGQYLLQLVLFAYRLILAIICLILYFILVFILYLVYLLFYPERRYKKKVEDKNLALDTDKQYKKHRLFGFFIGAFRGLVGGIVCMAFIGSIFYIAGGTGNHKYDSEVTFEDQSVNEGYQIYQALGSYGTSGIFKVLNTIKVKDNMPFYLYAADLVFSGNINDPNRGISTSFNFADEIGAYNNFTRKTVELLMKYGKQDLINAVNNNENVMDVVLVIIQNPDFQAEFNAEIDNFNAKTYFINFSLSLIDSIVEHIDQLKLAEQNSDAVETISLLFKKNYLSDYIPEEKEIKAKIAADPNYKYDTQAYVTASKLLTKDDAKNLLKFVIAALDLDNTDDETIKMMGIMENLLPSLNELSILDGTRKSELNDVYERLYVYLDNRYVQPSLQQNNNPTQDSSVQLLKGLEVEEIDWTYELSELMTTASNIMGIAKTVHNKDKEVFDNILNMFASTNDYALINEEKYDSIVESLKYSKLLNRVMSSEGMAAFIKNNLASSFKNIYVPSITYINTYDDSGNEVDGEAYNLLVGFKSLLKNEDTRELLREYKTLEGATETEQTKYVRSLLSALIKKDSDNQRSIDTVMNSILLRSIVTGAVTSSSAGNVKLIIPNAVLEEENGEKVNIIKKDELVNVAENLLLILPESGKIDNTKLVKTILANKDELLSSDIISATAINAMVNDNSTGLSKVLLIPDEYKDAASEENLKNYSSSNIWSSTNEIHKMLDGLDQAFDLSNSDVNFDDEESTTKILKANIKKLNEKIKGSDKTRLDVCYESIIIKASITNHMKSDKVKGIVIPTDSYDSTDIYVKDTIPYFNISKSELSKLVDVTNKLNLDLEAADINNIVLKKADVSTLASSKIFRSTMYDKIEKNESLVIPEDDETISNGYISESELTNLLNLLCDNRKNIFGTEDETQAINLSNITIDQNAFKVSELSQFISSNVLHATIINKIATSTSYGLSIPTKLSSEAEKTYLIDNFKTTNWYLKTELSNILSGLESLCGSDTLIGSVNEELIKSKILDDSFDINNCYASIILNTTISSKLAAQLNTLSRADVSAYTKEAISTTYSLDTTDFPEVAYKASEVDLLLKGVKALGITDISQLEGFDYSNAILSDTLNVDTLYNSILIWDILTAKMNDTITTNTKTVDHNMAYEERFSLTTKFYKEAEVESIRTVVKASGVTDIKSFGPSNIVINDTTKTAIGNSYVLMATITKNLHDSSEITTPSDTYEIAVEADGLLLYKQDIMDLLDVAKTLNIDLGNPSVNSIVVKNSDVPTLTESKIFRATIDTKLKANNQLVVPLDNETMNNGYISKLEMLSFLTIMLNNRKNIFGTEDETQPISVDNVNIDQNKFKLSELKTFIDSNILHATLINKIASSTSYGLSIPTKLESESEKTYLANNFLTTNWYLKTEVTNAITALEALFGSDTLIGSVDESAVKEKILNNVSLISNCYVSIIMNNTISVKLAAQLDTLNSADVTAYTRNNIASIYSLDSTDFPEVTYKESEVVLLLTAVKNLGVTDIDSISSFDYSSALLNDTLDVDSLYNSIIVWDVLTIKMKEKIASSATLKDHDQAFEDRYSLSEKFYKKAEISSLRTFMKECNLTNFDSFDISNLVINDTTLATVDTSFVIRATLNENIINKSSIIVPKNAYEFTDANNNTINLIYASEIKSLLSALKGTDIDLHTFDPSTVKPSDITDSSKLVQSYILRATISGQVKAEGTDLYSSNAVLDKDYLDNTIAVLTADEIVNLINGIKVFGDSFDIEISFIVIAGLTLDKQYTVMSSNVLAYIISDLFIDGFNIMGISLSYSTYTTLESTADLGTYGIYELVLVPSGGLMDIFYKCKDYTTHSAINLKDKTEITDAKLLTFYDVAAFVKLIKEQYGI